MEIVKAKNIAVLYNNYEQLVTLSKEIEVILKGGTLGMATITLPKSFLPGMKDEIDHSISVLYNEIDAL